MSFNSSWAGGYVPPRPEDYMNSSCRNTGGFPGGSVFPPDPSGFGLTNVIGNEGSGVDFQGAGCNQPQPLPQFPTLVPGQTGQIDRVVPDPIAGAINAVTEFVPFLNPVVWTEFIPAAGIFQGYDDATSLYTHFLYGDGTPRNDLPVGRMLSEIPNFRQNAQDFFNQNLIPRILSCLNQGTGNFQIGPTSIVNDWWVAEATLSVFHNERDWYNAVGGFRFTFVANVEATGSNIRICYRIYVHDWFDWNADIEEDYVLGGFAAMIGTGDNYEMTGVSEQVCVTGSFVPGSSNLDVQYIQPG